MRNGLPPLHVQRRQVSPQGWVWLVPTFLRRGLSRMCCSKSRASNLLPPASYPCPPFLSPFDLHWALLACLKTYSVTQLCYMNTCAPVHKPIRQGWFIYPEPPNASEKRNFGDWRIPSMPPLMSTPAASSWIRPVIGSSLPKKVTQNTELLNSSLPCWACFCLLWFPAMGLALSSGAIQGKYVPSLPTLPSPSEAWSPCVNPRLLARPLAPSTYVVHLSHHFFSLNPCPALLTAYS